MDLIEVIEMHPGVENAKQLAKIARSEPKYLEQLWEHTHHKKARISRISAWALEHCFLEDQELVMPYLPQMIQRLPEVPTDSLRRHFLKMIFIGGYTSEDYGILADVCFTWLTDANRPTGVKMFCMRILYEISEDEPDIKPELIAIIEDLLPKGTPGLKNRGNKILKELYREV